jgi:23S rRNA pseudouridine955/2504/2580 synthase
VRQVQSILIKSDDVGLRLDRWFKTNYPDISHGYLQKILRTGQVRLDGARVKAGVRLEEGQYIRVPPLEFNLNKKKKSQKIILKPIISKLDAKKLQASIVFQDDDIIIINKPSGLAVQGGSHLNRNLDDMLDALRFEKTEKPRLVHRLDKDTSGTLLLARHAPAARALAQAFKSKEMRKVYWAIVIGTPAQKQGMIDLKLSKQNGVGGEKVMASFNVGKIAQTFYRMVDHAGDQAAWIVFEPLTGRTHQIRAHALALGTPILGDGKYGQRKAFLKNNQIDKRLHLHARGLRFPHPAGHIMETIAPIPDHFKKTFRVLGFDIFKEKEPFKVSII